MTRWVVYAFLSHTSSFMAVNVSLNCEDTWRELHECLLPACDVWLQAVLWIPSVSLAHENPSWLVGVFQQHEQQVISLAGL